MMSARCRSLSVPLKFFAVRLARGRKERLDEIDEVAVRKWFFEKMNRAQAGSLFAVRGKMNAGQDDGARIRMARAQIVEKFLAQIGSGIDVENEQVRPIVHDEALGLFQIAAPDRRGRKARLRASAARIFAARSSSGSSTRMRPPCSEES